MLEGKLLEARIYVMLFTTSKIGLGTKEKLIHWENELIERIAGGHGIQELPANTMDIQGVM